MNSYVVAELKLLKSRGRSEEFVFASDRTDKHLGKERGEVREARGQWRRAFHDCRDPWPRDDPDDRSVNPWEIRGNATVRRHASRL